MPTAMDWARLATYIDTEGSIIIRTQDRRPRGSIIHYCSVVVCNTDRRMIDWCKNHFGGTICEIKPDVYASRPANHILYRWTYSYNAAELLRNCLPYLIIKAEQALVILAFRRTVTKGGQKLPKAVVEQRQSLHKLLTELKNKKRGYFEWTIPEDIKELFYWGENEPPVPCHLE